ncbi:MAG: aldehyde ferredoxin oxidoreductase N-terminal domain-containing protein [Candidatus Thorarchaeota archaeon]|jgi:aldehyde:ferredoxin oxidoreductase
MIHGQLLHIDLSNKNSEVIDRKDLFEKFIGGVGVASQLLLDNCPPNTTYDNAPIIFAIGPLNMYYPCCAKTVALFKSPLTGNLGESYAGGKLSMAMRLSGHDAIMITGKLDKPHYLLIQDENVEFRDAHALWGLSTRATGRILKEKAPGEGRRSILRIGVAGENQIRYAMVVVDTVRHFGRLGLGCVMGSKKLKGIVITGTHNHKVPSIKDYRTEYKKIHDLTLRTGRMDKYDILGTSINVLPLNELQALPTRNFSTFSFEDAEGISGERFADDVLIGKSACVPCPIGCIHIAQHRVQFDPMHRDYGTIYVPYDYEPIFALGSNLGVGSTDGVLHLIERVDLRGLDAISAGVVLGWITEAYEKGLVKPDDLAGLAPKWGNVDVYLKMLDYISNPPNAFYRFAGKGVSTLTERYGGKEFAVHFAGNEASGYHTGPANIVGHLVGIRHSHLDNAGYSIDQKIPSKAMSYEEIGIALAEEDAWRTVLNSLVVCLFARPVFTPDVVLSTMKSLGEERTRDELKQIGEEVFHLRMRFKTQEGFEVDSLRPPTRLLDRISPLGRLEETTIDGIISSWKAAHRL